MVDLVCAPINSSPPLPSPSFSNFFSVFLSFTRDVILASSSSVGIPSPSVSQVPLVLMRCLLLVRDSRLERPPLPLLSSSSALLRPCECDASGKERKRQDSDENGVSQESSIGYLTIEQKEHLTVASRSATFLATLTVAENNIVSLNPLKFRFVPPSVWRSAFPCSRSSLGLLSVSVSPCGSSLSPPSPSPAQAKAHDSRTQKQKRRPEKSLLPSCLPGGARSGPQKDNDLQSEVKWPRKRLGAHRKDCPEIPRRREKSLECVPRPLAGP